MLHRRIVVPKVTHRRKRFPFLLQKKFRTVPNKLALFPSLPFLFSRVPAIMEDQCGSKHHSSNGIGGYVDTSKAERAVWLMKCPPVVSRSLRAPPSDPSRPVAKVVVSIDPLNSNDDNDSPPQVAVSIHHPALCRFVPFPCMLCFTSCFIL